MVPPGEIFGLVPTWAGVYLLTVLMFGLAGIVLYGRVVKLILLGEPSGRFDRPMERFLGAMPLVFGQKKVLQRTDIKRDRAGLAHFFIFWGFLSFSLSYAIFIFADSLWPDFSRTLLTETGVRLYATYLDLLAVGFLIVLGWAALRRWVFTPRRLSFDLTQKPEAAIILGLITLLMVLTLLTDALYVASGGTGPAGKTIVGHAIGEALSGVLSDGAAGTLHAVAWWAHLGIILGFAVYIPMSKHMHLLGTPLSFFMRDLAPMGTLSTPKDLETMDTFGAENVKQFTWKQLLDGYACAVCGRCTDSCPANISGKILSPMHVAEGLKDQLIEEGGRILKNYEGGPGPTPFIGRLVQPEALWDCLTCGACEQECPVGVEHIDSIIDMRRHLVMEKSEMPETAMNALMNMEQRGHPWRGTTFSRTDWANGLEIKTLADHPTAEILFWVGCTGALEQRSQKIARSMASVLKRAGVDFAILGNEEECTGDPARRMGNEYLYQTMAQQNIEVFKQYNVKKIVTICPHCFNVIKNEYPHLAGNYEVVHYTQFVAGLIAQGKIKPVVELNTTMAYHDSCYLGRHNGVYDAPRDIANVIPGLKLVEMTRCKDRGFCCGAGGGHMWIEESRGRRVNHVRTEQFLETKADTVGVSCPFCLQMFNEGIQSNPNAQQKQAKDLIEMVEASLGKQ